MPGQGWPWTHQFPVQLPCVSHCMFPGSRSSSPAEVRGLAYKEARKAETTDRAQGHPDINKHQLILAQQPPRVAKGVLCQEQLPPREDKPGLRVCQGFLPKRPSSGT